MSDCQLLLYLYYSWYTRSRPYVLPSPVCYDIMCCTHHQKNIPTTTIKLMNTVQNFLDYTHQQMLRLAINLLYFLYCTACNVKRLNVIQNYLNEQITTRYWPEKGQEIQRACHTNVLDAGVGQMLQPSPCFVFPVPPSAEYQRIHYVPNTVHQRTASVDLFSIFTQQILNIFLLTMSN